MEFTNLTPDNIKLYAAGIYSNPGCSSFLEFEEDYLRIKYLKVLVYKLLSNKSVNLRIIINHIICLSNVFPKDGVARILLAEFEEESWNLVATFLFFLNLFPERKFRINNKDVHISGFSIDENLLERLREL